jgi:signal transduction histidine kinase
MWFIHQDYQNVFLVGTGSGLFRFDPHTESTKAWMVDDSASGRPKSGAVVAILDDHNRDLWIGTNNGGLRWFHRQTGAIETFSHIEGDSGSLGAGGVRSLLEDRKGNIWIGTGSGGLNLFDRETKRFKAFTDRDGLSGNHVNGILEDHRGRIWASSSGLCAFDPVTGQWSLFDESDGLQGDTFMIGSWTKCADGTLCFGGLNGLTLFRPVTLYPNTHAPPVMLTTIRLGGRRLVPAMWPPHLTEISYTYSGEVLSLEFAVLDFRRPDRNVCLYQMSGVNESWLKPYGLLGNTANYNLTPGNYIFRVKGTNNAGVRGRNTLALAIEVKPRYWETWWFRLIAGSALMGTIGVLYWRKVTRLRREKSLQQDFSRQLIESNETGRKHLAAELHDGLGQDLLVASNELQQFLQEGNGSREDVKRAASLVQESIQSVREIASNLHPHHLERLGFCAAIEAMTESISHSSGLSIDCSCDKVDGLVSKEVEIHAYRIMQEALANVVRHAKASKVTVQVARNCGSVEITVSDNGQGFTVEPSSTGTFTFRREEGLHGLGLTSMTERARIIEGTLQIKSSPGSGTTIHLTVPLS